MKILSALALGVPRHAFTDSFGRSVLQSVSLDWARGQNDSQSERDAALVL